MAANDFRVPPEMLQLLEPEARAKEELLALVESMSHDDRLAHLAEHKRWMELRGAK